MEKKTFQYNNVSVSVEDNKAKWEADKNVSGLIGRYDSKNNKLTLIVPETTKRDTTKNPALVKGEKTGMEVTVRKDGRYGFSWTLKQGELRLIGQREVEKEFKKCMTVLFEKLMVN